MHKGHSEHCDGDPERCFASDGCDRQNNANQKNKKVKQYKESDPKFSIWVMHTFGQAKEDDGKPGNQDQGCNYT